MSGCNPCCCVSMCCVCMCVLLCVCVCCMCVCVLCVLCCVYVCVYICLCIQGGPRVQYRAAAVIPTRELMSCLCARASSWGRSSSCGWSRLCDNEERRRLAAQYSVFSFSLALCLSLPARHRLSPQRKQTLVTTARVGASFVNTAVANIWAKAGRQSHQCAPACAICGVLSQPTPKNWRHEELIATTRNMRGGVAFERGRLKTVPFCCYSLVLASS